MRGLSEHAARRAASVQRSSATSVRTVSEDPARSASSSRRTVRAPCCAVVIAASFPQARALVNHH